MLNRTIINLTFTNDNVLVSYYIQDTESQESQESQETQESEEFPDIETIRTLLLSYFSSSESYFEYPVDSANLRSIIIIPFKTLKNVLSIDQINNLEKCELESTCPICIEDTSNNIKLNCQHIFCNECIKTWLSKQSNACPICRKIQ